MTIIVACKQEGVMVADTLLCDNRPGVMARVSHTPKIIRAPDGVLAGAAGGSGECSEFLQWVREERCYEPPARWFKGRNGIEGLLLMPDRTIFYYASPHPDQILADFHAIGSGTVAALAAHFVRASAEDCVRAACAVGLECGGEPMVLSL